MKLGDVIRIKRIWINQPESFTEGLIIGIRKTNWDESYRILTILTQAGSVTSEPLHLERDAKNVEYIIC